MPELITAAHLVSVGEIKPEASQGKETDQAHFQLDSAVIPHEPDVLVAGVGIVDDLDDGVSEEEGEDISASADLSLADLEDQFTTLTLEDSLVNGSVEYQARLDGEDIKFEESSAEVDESGGVDEEDDDKEAELLAELAEALAVDPDSEHKHDIEELYFPWTLSLEQQADISAANEDLTATSDSIVASEGEEVSNVTELEGEVVEVTASESAEVQELAEVTLETSTIELGGEALAAVSLTEPFDGIVEISPAVIEAVESSNNDSVSETDPVVVENSAGDCVEVIISGIPETEQELDLALETIEPVSVESESSVEPEALITVNESITEVVEPVVVGEQVAALEVLEIESGPVTAADTLVIDVAGAELAGSSEPEILAYPGIESASNETSWDELNTISPVNTEVERSEYEGTEPSEAPTAEPVEAREIPVVEAAEANDEPTILRYPDSVDVQDAREIRNSDSRFEEMTDALDGADETKAVKVESQEYDPFHQAQLAKGTVKLDERARLRWALRRLGIEDEAELMDELLQVGGMTQMLQSAEITAQEQLNVVASLVERFLKSAA